jgi:hypothetical protein
MNIKVKVCEEREDGNWSVVTPKQQLIFRIADNYNRDSLVNRPRTEQRIGNFMEYTFTFKDLETANHFIEVCKAEVPDVIVDRVS